MRDKRYKLSVPLPLIPKDENFFPRQVEFLKKMEADRAFLFGPPLDGEYLPDLASYDRWSEILCEKRKILHQEGIDTAFWMGHTIGHAGEFTVGHKPAFQELVGESGKTASGCYCPMDKKFKKYICDILASMAKSGVELILLDDDFRINSHPPNLITGCFCELHLNAFREKTGIVLSREEIIQQALCGEPGDMRRSWLEINEQTLLDFAEEIEQAVHAVNKDTRIGLATATTLWSNEGVDMRELLERLAGNTKPFLRLIGAPYWSKDPANLPWVIEFSRLQASWAEKWDVEIVTEGDTFPHTKYFCPASVLHAFTQGTFAAGIQNILSYSVVYSVKPSHEPAYVKIIDENKENYDAICSFFPSEYKSIGAVPVLLPNNMMNTTFPAEPGDAARLWSNEPVVIRFLARMGISIGYETGSAFLTGYSAAALSAADLDEILSRGVILDAVAAKILMDKGVDIGITSIQDAPSPVSEIFTDNEFSGDYDGDSVWLLTVGKRIYKKCRMKNSAKSIGSFTGTGDFESFPSVILYEDEKGRRFCTFAFDFAQVDRGGQLLYNYARQEQLTRCFAWVGKKPLPVTVNGYPDVHVICRESPDQDRIAVAIQNCHLDTIEEPVFRLDAGVPVGDRIELLLPGAKKAVISRDFTCSCDDTYKYLKIHHNILPMEMLGIGLVITQ